MKPPELDGVCYTKAVVAELRENLIVLRNGAIEHDRFDYAVGLSHVIAFLAFAIEELDS